MELMNCVTSRNAVVGDSSGSVTPLNIWNLFAPSSAAAS